MVQVTKSCGSIGQGLAEHTGQSSQLFSVTTGRNAQFLATVAGSALVRKEFAQTITNSVLYRKPVCNPPLFRSTDN